MEEVAADLNDRIAQRVRGLRAERGISLEALAADCGVSRSMISLIERGESNPTAVVLEKLATGLGVPLAALFNEARPAAEPLARRADQPCWQDPHSGYVRRNVSPPSASSPIQIVEVSFPPRARVAYETGPRDPQISQQVWVLEGSIEISLGAKTYQLSAGDCLAMQIDAPVTFHNPTDTSARYMVALTSVSSSRR